MGEGSLALFGAQTDEIETLTRREEWLVQKLKEYAVIDEDIQACKNAIDAGAQIPSITIRPPDEDDPGILAELNQPLRTEWQRETAATIEKYVDPTRFRYVSVHRAHKILASTYSDDLDEDYRIRDAADATKRDEDEYLHLTPTERAMVQYEKSAEDARGNMVNLMRKKHIIHGALVIMSDNYPEWHTLLMERYIRGQKYRWYLSHYQMSERTYRTERKNALKKFDRLAVGLR